MGHVNRNSDPRAAALISWQEALTILENCDAKGVPIPFAIAFSTCDEGAGTGGEIIRYEKAIWHVKGGRVNQSDSHERVGSKPAKSVKQNWVRKIRGLDTDQIRNVHIHLITEINGHPVR